MSSRNWWLVSIYAMLILQTFAIIVLMVVAISRSKDRWTHMDQENFMNANPKLIREHSIGQGGVNAD